MMANDEMAVEAVSSEPVSGLEFPGNREIYREFRASGAVLRRSNREEVPANRPLLGIRKLPGAK
jgi:hypothetical protein